MKPFKTLSRRAFLGGAGVMVSLPLLEAMIPSRAHAGGAGTAKRLLTIYVPNGIHMASWTPNATGAGFDLKTILQPLAPYQDSILVLSGLDNTPGQPDGPGDHAGGTSAFLTCVHVNKSETDITNGTSMDQLYADHIGGETVIPSMQLGIEGGGNTGGCDSGYSCAYSRNITWRNSTPLSKLTAPQTAFDLLFAGFDPMASAEQLAAIKANRLSVLDYTLADAEKLKGKLGTTDRVKMDEYLDSVRDLELKISTDEGVASCMLEGAAPGEPGDITNHIQLMLDVIVKAFECDRTRVISFMMGNAGSNRSYGFIGAPGGHHEYSHHGNAAASFAALEVIDTWEVEQLAYLLGKMQAIDEGGTSLLDNSMVFFSSEIEDGNSHAHTNLPVILAGGGGGTLDSGRHVAYGGQPLANLFIAMLQKLGVNVATFGDNGTGPLGNLG
jgi:hypothetical protein